jgi:hypothetical protein
MLIKHHQVVEHRHHRPLGGDRVVSVWRSPTRLSGVVTWSSQAMEDW